MSASLDTIRVSQVRSMTFAAGELQQYDVTLVGCSTSTTLTPQDSRPASFTSSQPQSQVALIDSAGGIAAHEEVHQSYDSDAPVGLHATHTGAFSPLSGSSSQHNAAPPSPDHNNYPLTVTNTGATHHEDCTESSQLDSSFGPSIHPTVAFCSDEILFGKFTCLLSCLAICCQSSSKAEKLNAVAALLQESPSTIHLSGFSEWADRNGLTGRRRHNGQEAVVVMVTPQQTSLAPPPQKPSQSFSIDTNEDSVAPRLENCATADRFCEENSPSQCVAMLVRECVSELPRLLHTVVALSPWKLSQQAVANSVLGRRGNVKLNGPQATPPPALGGLQHSAHNNSATSGQGYITPKFLLGVEVTGMLIELLSERLVVLRCDDSSEYNARLEISFQHLRERWPLAIEFLRQLAHDDGPAVSYARAAKTAGNHKPLSIGEHSMLPSEEIIFLASEWCRIALASRSQKGILREADDEGLIEGNHRRRSSLVAAGYLFSVEFDQCLGLDASGAHYTFPSAGVAAQRTAEASQRSDSYHEGPLSAQPSADLFSSVPSIDKSWKVGSHVAASLFATLTAIATAIAHMEHAEWAGAISIVLLLLSLAAAWRTVQEWSYERSRARAERFLMQRQATIVNILLRSPPERTPVDAISPSPQQSTMTAAAAAQANGGTSSALGSTYAISTPSPYPSNNASVTDAFMMAMVKGGNTTPLGFFANNQSTTVPPPTVPTQHSIRGEPSLLLNGSTSAAKKPNPLSAEAFLANDPTMLPMEEAGVVRVRMDPTGTFLIPFIDNEPILLDGVHIHKHLSVVGIEFTRKHADDVSSENNSSKTVISKSGGDLFDSMLVGDETQDEDRYSICMWNHAMTEATGGYSAQQILDQTLASVVGDNDSYAALIQLIRRCEEAFNRNESDTFQIDPIIVRFVHRELGSCAMRVTLSPVVRYDDEICGGVRSVDDTSNAAEGKPICIGVLVVGVPVDPQHQTRAYAFRNLYLTEVLEECIAVANHMRPQDNNNNTAALATVASFVSPTLSRGGPIMSPASPSKFSVASKAQDARRINEYFTHRTIQELASVASLNDSSWKPVYSNFIPGILTKGLPRYPIRVKVDQNVPSLVEANIPAVTKILDQIFNTIPSTAISTSKVHLSTGAMGASQRSNASLTSQERFLAYQPQDDHFIRVTFGLLDDDGASMFCKLDNIQIERYVEMVAKDMDMEELTGVKGPSTSLGLLRAADAKLILMPGQFDLSTTGQVISPDADEALTSQPEPSIASATPQGSASMNSARRVRYATQCAKDSVIILFPFRVHNASSNVRSAWETRDKKATSSGAASCDTSQRDSRNTSSGGLGASIQADSSTATPTKAGDEPVVLAVLIDASSELDRTKLTRQFWEDHHSVFPVDSGKMLSRGVKLLRSHCRPFDTVITEFPSNIPEQEFEKRMEEIAKEFPEVTFILLRQKHRRKHSTATGAPLPMPPKVMEKKESALISFFAPPDPKPKNFHILPKVITPHGIAELIQYAVAKARDIHSEQKKKQQLQQIFREHRTGPWTKGRKLGKGTFGDVFEAILPLTGGKMAVKVIRLPSSDPSRMEQLINEVEILAKVQHPNIVQYFYCEASNTAGEVNVFMELCTGGCLAEKCKSTTKELSITHTSAWIQQTCSAIAYLHRNHLAHRDIKPANLLLSETGQIKLADFGTAAAVSVPLRDIAGTFAYMAPEVYAGADYGTPCDIWSIGCVMLDLLGPIVCQKIVGSGVGGLNGGYFSDVASDQEIWKRLESNIEDAMLVDFLRGCFRLDPLQRSTAEQLLLHPFLTSNRMRSSGSGSNPVAPTPKLSVKRSSPNLNRKSTESVGALSMDSGDFGRRGGGCDDDDDDDSDDGWGDLVRGDSDDDNEPALENTASVFNSNNNNLAVPHQAFNAFTPKHNVPTPTARPKSLVVQSPSAHRRQQAAAPGDIPDSATSPYFATNAAAMARRQSNVKEGFSREGVAPRRLSAVNFVPS